MQVTLGTPVAPHAQPLSGGGSAKISLASRSELERAFTVVTDHIHGELERELYSRRRKPISPNGPEFGEIRRIERKYNLPTVMVGDSLESALKTEQRKVADLRAQLAKVPRPRPGGNDPWWVQRSKLTSQIKVANDRASRLYMFRLLHRKQAKSTHSVALALEEEIVDLIHTPWPVDDVNVFAELKLFVYWTVADGRLSLKVSDLFGTDLWAETDHLIAVVAGYGGQGVPSKIARDLAWTYSGLPIQQALPSAVEKVRQQFSLGSDVAIRIDDIYLEGDSLQLAVSWTSPFNTRPIQ